MTSSCSRASCFNLTSSSFSMAIDASAESRVCPVAFREYVLMRLRAEKDRSTEAGMVWYGHDQAGEGIQLWHAD